jgi:hypothetical protein
VAAQASLFWQVEKPNDCNAVQAQVARMGRDAHDAAHLQQQLQGKERLLGEVNDAHRQAQVCLTLLAYVWRRNASRQSISHFCM